jgi:hypothetical protein
VIGHANRGITNRDEIIDHAMQLRKRHISTTTFGVGADFDEVLLQQMAEAGGENFYFIATAQGIPRYISHGSTTSKSSGNNCMTTSPETIATPRLTS